MPTPARLLALVTSVLVMLVMAPAAALADAPNTWEVEKEPLDVLGYLVLLVGIPGALFAVIWVIAFALSRKNYTAPAPGSENAH
ncbi:MAG: hypothetical protein QM621_09905 [Aeromicrobium sp.]|uniref:hypothetical protein n=1 Tax=Aeromicrobium sp. TaxID=1871063 RepID=UPI0039E45419